MSPLYLHFAPQLSLPLSLPLEASPCPSRPLRRRAHLCTIRRHSRIGLINRASEPLCLLFFPMSPCPLAHMSPRGRSAAALTFAQVFAIPLALLSRVGLTAPGQPLSPAAEWWP